MSSSLDQSIKTQTTNGVKQVRGTASVLGLSSSSSLKMENNSVGMSHENPFWNCQPKEKDEKTTIPMAESVVNEDSAKGATANEQPHFASHKARRSSFSTALFELSVGFDNLLEMRPMQKLAAQLANKYADDSGMSIRLLFVHFLNGASRIRK
ncbi:hypothetical protein Tco_1373605, partial [Tanacetum coccineum]